MMMIVFTLLSQELGYIQDYLALVFTLLSQELKEFLSPEAHLSNLSMAPDRNQSHSHYMNKEQNPSLT